MAQIRSELEMTNRSISKITSEGVLSTGRNKRLELLLKKVKRLQKALAYAAPQGSPILLTSHEAHPVLQESKDNQPGSPIYLDPPTPCATPVPQASAVSKTNRRGLPVSRLPLRTSVQKAATSSKDNQPGSPISLLSPPDTANVSDETAKIFVEGLSKFWFPDTEDAASPRTPWWLSP